MPGTVSSQWTRVLVLALSWATRHLLVTAGCPCNYCGPTTLCHNMGLLEVPYTIPTSDVTRLLLYGNQITRLFANEFQGMYEVTELDLHANRIQEVDEHAFTGLPNIETLYLSENRIGYIPQGALRGLSKLSRLFLDKNKLKRLPADIPYLAALTRLNLGDNQISSVPWTDFTPLRELEIAMLWRNPLRCDCDTLELRKWFHAQSKDAAVSTDMQLNNCTEKNLIEKCRKPSLLGVEHVRPNRTSGYGETRPPNTATYVQSNRATLHCNTTGDPAPLAVWKTPAAGNVYPYSQGRMRAYVNGTLYIAYLRPTDSGDYTCNLRLVDVTNMTSPGLTIKVVKGSKPRIVRSKEKEQGVAASKIELLCKYAGNPAPDIEWYAPDAMKPLSEANFTSGSKKYKLKDGGARLEITDLSAKDAGVWRCRASNRMGFDAAYIQVMISAENNQLTVFIGVGCAVVAVIVAVVAAVVCVAAKWRHRHRDESATRRTHAPQSLRVIEEGTLGNEAWQNKPAKKKRRPTAAKDDVLQQPFTQIPKIKGIRI